jgi:hypothetical protein
MSMSYAGFLQRVIEEGIEAARQSYGKKEPHMLKGSIEGFDACRGKTPYELGQLLIKARQAAMDAAVEKMEEDSYWRVRCYELEIDWVCNVVSAVLMNEGQPTIVPPTARAVLKAADIIGVRGASA